MNTLKYPVTWLTTLLCLALFVGVGDHSSLYYDRQNADDIGRFLSSSFIHFNSEHLTSNSLMFFIFGQMVEKKHGSLLLLLLILAIASMTTLTIHFLFQEYTIFAGISSINYALLGVWLYDKSRKNGAASALLLTLVLVYQLIVIFNNSHPVYVQAYHPTWQVHLIGLFFGLLLVPNIHYLKQPRVVTASR